MREYKIINDNNGEDDFKILPIHFGRLWESILNRLGSQYDGYVMTIHHQHRPYKIYRL